MYSKGNIRQVYTTNTIHTLQNYLPVYLCRSVPRTKMYPSCMLFLSGVVLAFAYGKS